jgi:predicted porin
MRAWTLLLGVAGCTSPAVALAQVTLTGAIDLMLRIDGGAGGTNRQLASSGARASRLTFSAGEDLGQGWRSQIVLDAGFEADSGRGAATPAGVPPGSFSFGRTAFVSVGHETLGYVAAGRLYTPLWGLSAGPANDPFAAGWFGGIATVYGVGPAGGTTIKAPRAITYSLGYGPRATMLPAPLKGLGLALMHAFAEGSEGAQSGGNVSYGNAHSWLGYGWHLQRSSGGARRQQTLAGSHDFGPARLHLGFNRASGKQRNTHVAVTAPLSRQGVVLALIGHSSRGLRTLQVGYQHDLTRRTALYAVAGWVDNEPQSAALLLGAQSTPTAGVTARSLGMGISHAF